MNRVVIVGMSALFTIHGLVHGLGFVANWRLARIEGLPYQTTVLGGRVDVGDAGMRVLGVAFLLAAIGFAAAGWGCWTGASWWRGLLLVTTLLSLVITALEWDVAYAGTVVDLVILAGMGLTAVL
jgi:hypothetical protein